MTTDKLCEILATLGGKPEELPDKMDDTIVDAIIGTLANNSGKANKAPTSAEVATAIDSMTASQVTKVKRKLGIS